MNIEELKALIQLLKEEGLTEITLWEGERRITVRREAAVVRREETLQPGGESPGQEAGTFTVTSPLVGTLYLRPSPEEEPFIAEGAHVEPGTTLCIIEAMKVMNEIKAEEAGQVRRILVKDGEAVEYGQPLFLVERP